MPVLKRYKVFPGHPGPVHIQDRVHDLAQIMERLADAQAGALLTPPDQDRVDERPAGVRQIGAVWLPGIHAADL